MKHYTPPSWKFACESCVLIGQLSQLTDQMTACKGKFPRQWSVIFLILVPEKALQNNGMDYRIRNTALGGPKRNWYVFLASNRKFWPLILCF